MTNSPDPKAQLIERIRPILFNFEVEAHSARIDALSPKAYENKMHWLLNSAIEALASAWIEDVEKAKLETVTHIMSVDTEGLFDNGDLFIKRKPIEQAVVDVIGFEAFKALQESLPVADPSNKSKEQA